MAQGAFSVLARRANRPRKPFDHPHLHASLLLGRYYTHVYFSLVRQNTALQQHL
jgi:hypothetical protein